MSPEITDNDGKPQNVIAEEAVFSELFIHPRSLIVECKENVEQKRGKPQFLPEFCKILENF